MIAGATFRAADGRAAIESVYFKELANAYRDGF